MIFFIFYYPPYLKLWYKFQVAIKNKNPIR